MGNTALVYMLIKNELLLIACDLHKPSLKNAKNYTATGYDQ
jgi:hypothetical protein